MKRAGLNASLTFFSLMSRHAAGVKKRNAPTVKGQSRGLFYNNTTREESIARSQSIRHSRFLRRNYHLLKTLQILINRNEKNYYSKTWNKHYQEKLVKNQYLNPNW